MSFEMTVRGLDTLNQRITELGVVIGRQVAIALRAEAEIEMTEAKRRTPVDTGALKGSGHVTGPDEQVGSGAPAQGRNAKGQFTSKGSTRGFGGQRTWAVTLAFGGPAAPYALEVHENLEAYHPRGQAKYLESVILESAPHMAQRIARRVGSLRP